MHSYGCVVRDVYGHLGNRKQCINITSGPKAFFVQSYKLPLKLDDLFYCSVAE